MQLTKSNTCIKLSVTNRSFTENKQSLTRAEGCPAQIARVKKTPVWHLAIVVNFIITIYIDLDKYSCQPRS